MQLSELTFVSPVWTVFCLILAGVVGAVMGSFIDCLAWRLVHGENVWKGRSHCAKCGHVLSALDLIPVISWVCLRGRCRYCKQKVSARYVVTELVCALYFISIVWMYGLTVHTLALWVLGCVLLGLSLVDLDSFLIPNGFIIAGILTWVVSFWTYGVPIGGIGLGSLMLGVVGSPIVAVLVDGLLGAFGVAAAMLVLSFLFDHVVGRQSLGGGDLKLLFMVGLYVGLAANVLTLILACIVGIIFALATQKVRKNTIESDKQLAHNHDDQAESDQVHDPRVFPFGPSIALAAWVVLLLGSSLLGWYFSLF